MKLIKGWWLPDTDTHFEHYIKDGGYQTVHRNTILNHIILNKHILENCIDVGSHVGFWSKDFTKIFKHVYAFDPISDVRDCYVKNITTDNYTLYPYGVGSKEKNIKVTSIHPGGVNTPMWKDNVDFHDKLDKLLRPEDVADMVYFITEQHYNVETKTVKMYPDIEWHQ